MNQRLVLFAKFILTMDRPRPIEDGFVMIQGSRILQVGKRKDLYLRPSFRMLDLGDTVLLPGLINAHCHLDYTSFKGRVRYAGGFRKWLSKMAIKTRGTTTAEFKRSIQKGIKESLAFGTTTLCDISTSWESYSLLRQSGLRSFVFLELIDLGNPSAKDYWRQFQEKLRVFIRAAPPTPTFRLGLSPHTPFTVSKELLQSIRSFLQDHQELLTTIHVAESREEADYFKKGRGPIAERIKILNPDWAQPRKTTPVQYLNDGGWLPQLDLGVHLNEVDEKDLRLLAKNRTVVVHCPGSHAFFKRRPFRYERMRRNHIPISLGTDSLASNQSLSLFREMRLFQKAHPAVPASEILSMVTVKPAQALGLGRQLGQIKPGYLADLIGIPLSPGRMGSKDLAGEVLRHKGPVSFSMIHGESRLRLSPLK
jgi:cytosine/adenosine deaminase-related metal-dependent hydrolase